MAERYDAFISYSHDADTGTAAALRRGLQRFAKPWNRRRAMRVFLDSDSLEATASLSDALEDRLGRARYLVLLASNDSARSEWCDREAAFWLEHRGADHVLLVLTDAAGDLVWDDRAGAFDPARSPSLPPSLLTPTTPSPCGSICDGPTRPPIRPSWICATPGSGAQSPRWLRPSTACPRTSSMVRTCGSIEGSPGCAEPPSSP